MTVDHYDALFTLASGGPLANRVFDSVRVDGDGKLTYDQYLILFHTVAEPSSERFTLPVSMQLTLDLEFDVRAVGTTSRAAALTMDKFMTRAIGARLVVPGRSCTPIQVGVSGSRVIADRSVKPPLFYQDASVTLVSRPS